MQSNSHFANTSTRIPEIHAPSLGLGQFNLQTLKRDAPAGIITGLMAIPLSVGICLMSDYPIQVGLMTVIVACLVSFLFYLIRPGNHIGVPGVAAGLAPVLAMGIHKYGMERMPWIIFLTSMMQMLVWRYRLEGYILKAVPKFLIEGLLAGVGLKIAMKFIPYTYAISTQSGEHFWSNERLIVVMSSIVALLLFVYLYKRFKDKSPGIPYIAVIGGGAWLGTFIHFPMLEIDHVNFHWAVPWREVIDLTKTSLSMHLEMFLFSAMLMLIDVIEQVMSNAAIQSIDPLGRKSDSNNSLLVMWFANGISSFFGGMTNLDGLAKSSTNQMAGAVTKMSVLFVAMVLGVVLYFPIILSSLPEFSLAVLMIFTGWKMIAGLYHVAQYGKYEFGLAMFCGILVFRLGIFEGLLICLALHSFIVYIIYRHEKIPTFAILKNWSYFSVMLFIHTRVRHYLFIKIISLEVTVIAVFIAHQQSIKVWMILLAIGHMELITTIY
jgi:MFS superfamily sulfate permease-like transporter